MCPCFDTLDQCFFDLGPIMKGCRIKVGSVGPDQGMDFRVKPDLIKELKILQWTVKIANQYGLEINHLMGVIFKLHAKGIGPGDGKFGNPVDGMRHELSTLKWGV